MYHTQHEIHALDYSISRFVAALDHLLQYCYDADRFRIAGTLHVAAEGESGLRALNVHIRPDDWPEDSGISARFELKRDEIWDAVSAKVNARHVRGVPCLEFQCSFDSDGQYTFKAGNHAAAILFHSEPVIAGSTA